MLIMPNSQKYLICAYFRSMSLLFTIGKDCSKIPEQTIKIFVIFLCKRYIIKICLFAFNFEIGKYNWKY